MPKVKTHSLRKLKKEELLKNLDKEKEELLKLRVQKQVTNSAQKLMKIRETRKKIARINTVITQKTRAFLREAYKTKKYIPLDLRPKKTRAIRQRLTKEQAKLVPRSVIKKRLNFPRQTYFLKSQ